MPTFRQYPVANSLVSTDVVLIDRIGVGTLEANVGLLTGNTVIYDLAIGVPGTPPANSGVDANAGVFAVFNAVRSVEIPTQGSIFTFSEAPTANTSMQVCISGTGIGQVSWQGGHYVGEATYTAETPIQINIGEQLQFVAPTNWYGASTLGITIPLIV